jgi:hypothetical protein
MLRAYFCFPYVRKKSHYGLHQKYLERKVQKYARVTGIFVMRRTESDGGGLRTGLT